jgi:8-oxo-dGTP diphosphatase
MDVARVALSVDVACFALEADGLRLLLVRRQSEPFAGSWALPGGAVAPEERLDDAARRVLAERTGLRDAYLEQLYTFGDPGRDPRGRTVAVAYLALLPAPAPDPQRGREVSAATWTPAASPPPLAFDHQRIADYARWRLAQKLEYSPLAFRVLPERFTMGDLRRVHETVLGRPLDASNFARQMLARWDLAPVPGERDRRSRRPARLYRYIGEAHIAGPPPSPS